MTQKNVAPSGASEAPVFTEAEPPIQLQVIKEEGNSMSHFLGERNSLSGVCWIAMAAAFAIKVCNYEGQRRGMQTAT